MEVRIKAQKAKVISGVGLVLQFVVLEGVIRADMKTKFKGTSLIIGDRLFAYKNAREAEKALDFMHNEGVEYRHISEAKSEDGIIQANLVNAAGAVIKARNKRACFFNKNIGRICKNLCDVETDEDMAETLNNIRFPETATQRRIV